MYPALLLVLHLAMRLVARTWTRIANIERDLDDIDSMADAWMKQQARLKEAIAQARREASKSADSDDE